MLKISNYIQKRIYPIIMVAAISIVSSCQKQIAVSVDVATAAEIKDRIATHSGEEAVLVNFWVLSI